MTTKKKIKIKVKKTKVTQSGNIVKVNINTRGGASRPSGGTRAAASSGARPAALSGPSIIIQQPSQSQAQPNTQLLDMLQRAYAQNLENNQNFRKLNPANLNDVNNAVAIAQNSARQIVANTPEPDQVNRPPLPPLPPLRRPEVIQKPIQPQRLTGMAAVVEELRRRQEQNTLLPIPGRTQLPEPQTTEGAMFRLQTQMTPANILPQDIATQTRLEPILESSGERQKILTQTTPVLESVGGRQKILTQTTPVLESVGGEGITRTKTPVSAVINRMDETIANVQNRSVGNTPYTPVTQSTETNPPSAKTLSFGAPSPQSSVAASQSSPPLQRPTDIRLSSDKETALQTGVQVEGPRERKQTQFYGQ